MRVNGLTGEIQMKIYDLMTSQPHTIEEEVTIVEAAEGMQSFGCGIFPVGCQNKITGILTDRDIINRVISQKLDPNKTLVKNIMTRDVIFCYEDESIPRAIGLMNKHKIRRIVVINDKLKLVGILSMIDIFKRLKDKTMLANLFSDAMYLH